MSISIVQFAKGQASGTSVSATFGSTPTNGNHIIAVLASAGPSSPGPVTMTGGTFSKKVTGAVNWDVEIWLTANSISGAGTTVTGVTNAGDSVIFVIEVSGLADGSLDVTGTNSGVGAVLTTSSSATTSPSEIWLAAFNHSPNGVSYTTPTNGFTIGDQLLTSSGGADGAALAGWSYKIVSTTGTPSTGVTCSASSGWDMIIATFTAPKSGQDPLWFGMEV